ncbi:sulfatase-like hydrolase/transferase [Galbibacter mesophilus]|uniref:sulfatase-like hydrolase/transferase n=1 Tax=Galbibacter mesophilus TaxID=379069 RepID=UPI00191F02C9|nr:sulfatase-like hydrolase/transferase [Galbibacter mesophilus]MCM5664031.1 sulfatase-like hydrolase/transferase [Galbibacter mesophilus]
MGRLFLLDRLLILLFLSCICAQQSNGQSSKKTNIIIILADDLGYADVGFNGCKDIPTPNIDRIANEGVKFTNAYVTYAVCGPSRAGLITGRYQDRFGFARNPLFAPNDRDMGLPLTEQTLATVLKPANYKSVILGKWHLGAHKDLHPLNRGFDDFFGFLSGGHDYFPENWTLKDPFEAKSQFDGYKTKLLRNFERIEEQEYLTDALSREAVQYIETYKEQPFFMYLAYNAPHTPLQATEKYLERFNHIKNSKRKAYAAMVSAMDDGIGKVLDKLESLNLSNDTIVFFLSDNGGPEKVNGSNNGILRGGKGDLFEGGIHIPFAMRWPAQVKGNLVFNKPVSSLDIFATAIQPVVNRIKLKKALDGVDLVPFVKGEIEEPPHSNIFWRKFDANWFAVRSSDGNKILSKNEKLSLFNVQQHISESVEVDNKELEARLLKKYKIWKSQLKPPSFLGLLQNNEYNKLHPNRFKKNE